MFSIVICCTCVCRRLGLLKQRSIKSLPWEERTSADVMTVRSTVRPDDVQGNEDTIEDRALENDTKPSIMSEALIDKLHTQFALGELSINDIYGAIPKIKEGENQTITNKIVDIGLDRKQSKYDWPHEYQIQVGLVSKPPMYGVPHNYPTYEEVDSKSPKYEVSQKYQTCVGLDTNPPKYEVLHINPTKECNELPQTYPTHVKLDTKQTKNKVPHRYQIPVRLDTTSPKYAVPNKYPTHVGLDTKFPKYEVPHKYPTHVGLDTKPTTYKVPHTYQTHLSTGIYMQRNTADGHKPCVDGYLIENRMHCISEKTQYTVPTASPIGHNNQDYFSNTEECALAELNKDHQTKMKPKRPSLTDSDTETKMNEILAMTNELNLFKQPDACIERTQSHKEKGLNDKIDTDFDKAITEILNSSEDDDNHNQKSQFKGERGRSRKTDITSRRTRRNSSDHDSSEPWRAKQRPTQEIKSSILTQGNDTDEDIDDILKSTGTLVDMKRSNATDARPDDSTACYSEDDYLSESPIVGIRCVSPEVESRDLILPFAEPVRQYDVVNDSEIVDGKVQVVELTHYDKTVLDNAEVEEGKTKNYGKSWKFFSRLFCCFKPKLEN